MVNRIWKIFRALVVTVVVLVVGVPAAVYLVVSTDWAQQSLCRAASDELSALLATRVHIDRVRIHPFDRLSVYGVTAMDDYGCRALKIDEVSGAFELMHLLTTGKIVIDYALVDGADIVLYKQTKESPLNIAKILDRLRSKDKKKPPTRFELRINTVILRQAALSYDVLNQPRRRGFDPNHVSLTDLALHAFIPKLSNDWYTVELDRLSFREACGFELKHLSAKADVRSSGIDLSNLHVELPRTSLSLAPVRMTFDRFEQLPKTLADTPTQLVVERGSYLYLPDLKAFVPKLKDLDMVVDLNLRAAATLNAVTLQSLYASDRDGALTVQARGRADGLRNPRTMLVDLRSLDIDGYAPGIARRLAQLGVGGKVVGELAAQIQKFKLHAEADGRLSGGDITANAVYGPGAASTVDLQGSFTSPDMLRTVDFKAAASLGTVHVGQLARQDKAGLVSGRFEADGRIAKGKLAGNFNADIAQLQLMGYEYRDIALEGSLDAGHARLSLDSRDPNAAATVHAEADFGSATRQIILDGTVRRLNLNALHLDKRYPGYSIAGAVQGNLVGSNVDDLAGHLHLRGLHIDGPDRNFTLDRCLLDIEREGQRSLITLDSDVLEARVEGKVAFSSLVPQLRSIAATVLPDLVGQVSVAPDAAPNNFDFEITVDGTDALCDFVNSPVRPVKPVVIHGTVSSPDSYMMLNLDAPALKQSDKLIEGSALYAKVDGLDRSARVTVNTKLPTKKGPLALAVDLSGADNRIDSHIDWLIQRRTPLNGQINFSTLLTKNLEHKLDVNVDLNRSEVTFGDDLWTLKPAGVHYSPAGIDIDGFEMTTADQSVAVNGRVGRHADDVLEARLQNFDVAGIFKTLEIDNVLIGGRLTGLLRGSALLSPQPVMRGDALDVAGISYNNCVFGDAKLNARFDANRKAFHLDADILSQERFYNRIYGDIFVGNGGGLDLNFNCQKVDVGFLRPYLAGFTTGVSGHASGQARLFGTFKDLDIEGDLKADNFGMRIGFTNSWYYSSDSVVLRSGRIILPDMTIRDAEGHTALLSGTVKHRKFREMSFDISVTKARNLLCYDVDAAQSPIWHGHVYGNGSAFVKGDERAVNISVNMTSAPGSRFSFVILDQKDAADYSFITFRPKPGTDADSVAKPAIKLKPNSAAVNLDLNIDINPDVAMNILLNPQSGDEIKAIGNGNLRLFYGSLNNDLYLYGNYVLERGSYRFTLQDIILKDFTINQGSSISFNGDPYNPRLDLKATYQVNANLTDLDESFAQDKEINRTNVPVQAMLFVTGPLMQPDIKFDLQFPTLNEDVYRKVRSIVSTEDMMNRQIFYLLALNRFYTPEYMASTTKGNEMFSVASSTISSQISSMLGKLSEQWSIAPNLRSDRGDFSDVEVDVALSSRLLNNRLLFNGNFGYRDKTLNPNQFVGDFDVQYLLTRQGDVRLKAYNRYNDQNYYLRSAPTTQGVGIMLRHDFDDLRSVWPFRWLRRTPADSTRTAPAKP